jgi:hypothetical protein
VSVVSLVDVDGAVRAWVNGIPGLTGVGNPLPNGVHFGARSPSQGAWAELRGVVTRQPSDVADIPRYSVAVKAVGSKQDSGAYYAASRAALALARAVVEKHGVGVVTTARGDLVRIVGTGDANGPTYLGNEGGEETFLLDFAIVAQPA